MKSEKAIEYFSGYYEGTLEPGLMVQMEKLLSEDAQTAIQYASFAAALDDISILKGVAPEVPHDLHEQIMRKVDFEIWDKKQKRSTSFFGQWKLAFISGVAALAILASADFFSHPSNGFVAGLLFRQPAAEPEPLMVKMVNGVPTITRNAEETITMTDLSSGKVVKEIKVSQQTPQAIQLTNSGSSAAVYEIRSSSNLPVVIAAIPGKDLTPGDAKAGGTVAEFARSCANFYNRAVVLKLSKTPPKLTWNLDADPAKLELDDVSGLTVSVTDGLIHLRNH